MVKIFRDDRTKGMPTYKKLNSNEVPRLVVERMTNGHRTHSDDWIIYWFFVLASNSLLFPSASMNISGSDYTSIEDLEAANGYDWCQGICYDLKVKAVKLRTGRSKKLPKPTIQGHILFFLC
jgi:hypothetical protein